MTRWEVIAGDSLAVLSAMPDASVDAVVTDPPYSSGGQYRGDRAERTGGKYLRDESAHQALADFAGDNRDQRAWAYWCTLWLSECLRVAKPGAPIAMFADWRQLPTATDALQSGGWVWRGIAVWDKTEAARPRLGGFRAQAEYIVWGSAGPLAVYHGAPALAGVLREYLPSGQREHQTQKPTGIMREVVKLCPPGGLVLDPFCGSGTTGVAALHEGRRFVGIERVAAYVDTSRRRLTAADADTDGRSTMQPTLGLEVA